MKRLSTILAALCLCLIAAAQTNFRTLSYGDALKAAKTEKKNVFIDFYTDWCGPCKMMARNVFPKAEVAEFMNKGFVSIKVNAEKGDGVALAKQFKINAYPTMIVADADGKELGRMVGSMPPDALINKLEQFTDPAKTPAAIKKAYDNGVRTPEVVSAYAANSIDDILTTNLPDSEKVAKYDAVVDLVQDYFSKLPDADRLKPENMFVYRKYVDTPFSPAGRFYYKNIGKFPVPQRAEVDSIMRERYVQEVCALLVGEKKYGNERLDSLKREISQLKIDKDGGFSAAYTLINAAKDCNSPSYFKLCEANFNRLNPEIKSYYIVHFSDLFKNAPDTVKKEASAFMRKHIGEFPVRTMYGIIMSLAEFEGIN